LQKSSLIKFDLQIYA